MFGALFAQKCGAFFASYKFVCNLLLLLLFICVGVVGGEGGIGNLDASI